MRPAIQLQAGARLAVLACLAIVLYNTSGGLITQQQRSALAPLFRRAGLWVAGQAGGGSGDSDGASTLPACQLDVRPDDLPPQCTLVEQVCVDHSAFILQGPEYQAVNGSLPTRQLPRLNGERARPAARRQQAA